MSHGSCNSDEKCKWLVLPQQTLYIGRTESWSPLACERHCEVGSKEFCLHLLFIPVFPKRIWSQTLLLRKGLSVEHQWTKSESGPPLLYTVPPCQSETTSRTASRMQVGWSLACALGQTTNAAAWLGKDTWPVGSSYSLGHESPLVILVSLRDEIQV